MWRRLSHVNVAQDDTKDQANSKSIQFQLELFSSRQPSEINLIWLNAFTFVGNLCFPSHSSCYILQQRNENQFNQFQQPKGEQTNWISLLNTCRSRNWWILVPLRLPFDFAHPVKRSRKSHCSDWMTLCVVLREKEKGRLVKVSRTVTGKHSVKSFFSLLVERFSEWLQPLTDIRSSSSALH